MSGMTVPRSGRPVRMPWLVRLILCVDAAVMMALAGAFAMLSGDTWGLIQGVVQVVIAAAGVRKVYHMEAGGAFRVWVRPLRCLLAPQRLAGFGSELIVGIVMFTAGRALHDPVQAFLPTVLGVMLIGIAVATWLVPAAPSSREAYAAEVSV